MCPAAAPGGGGGGGEEDSLLSPAPGKRSSGAPADAAAPAVERAGRTPSDCCATGS